MTAATKQTPQQLNLNIVLEQVEKEKGISKEVLIEAIESALLTAANKKYGELREIEASFNSELGEIELFEFKEVVEEVTNPECELSIEDAKKTDSEAVFGDSLGFKMDISDFGRIAAQTAKQVIIQKVRNAERDNIYEEYHDKVNELITGMVQRFERGQIYVNLGRAEAVIPQKEQVNREGYRQGDRIRAYILEVLKESKGPQIILSRTNPGLLVKLFELEVPEINEGIVNIMCVSREAGERSKIAVASNDSDVDPVGACVGIKGSRVQSIVQELRGEKIDIVPWDDDPFTFVRNALSPAEVSEIIIDDDVHTMEVIVEDDQLSLAIGKKGQNVRLASKLVGWKLDIKSSSKKEKLFAEAIYALGSLPGVGLATAEILYQEGITSPKDLVNVGLDFLSNIPHLGPKTAEKLYNSALEVIKGGDVTTQKEIVEDTKEETVEDTKEEIVEDTVEETVEDTVEDTKEEIVEDTKEETVEDTKEEIVEDTKEEKGEDTVEEIEEVSVSLENLEGVGEKTRELLVSGGFDDVKKIAESNIDELSGIDGIGEKKAESIIESAKKFLEGES